MKRGLLLFLLLPALSAADLFLPPSGGWDAGYEGNAAASAATAALDGNWNHNNPSDIWSGSTSVVYTSTVNEVSFLHIHDALTSGDDRKFMFGYDLESLLGIVDNAFLDDGFTLHTRFRLPDGQGYGIHNSTKGMFNISQRSEDSFGMSLNNNGELLIGSNDGTGQGTVAATVTGLTAWHEAWLTFSLVVSNDYQVTLYLDGDTTPAFQQTLTALQNGQSIGTGGFTREYTHNYLAFGLGSSAFTGNFDLDFIRFSDALLPPEEPVQAQPEILAVAYHPATDTLTLRWTSEPGRQYDLITTDQQGALPPPGQWLSLTNGIPAQGLETEWTIPDVGTRLPDPWNLLRIRLP
jgi:hypothetical protein